MARFVAQSERSRRENDAEDDKCVVPEARERNRRGDIVCAECIERERAASDSNGRHDGGDEEAPNESQANAEKAESEQ